MKIRRPFLHKLLAAVSPVSSKNASFAYYREIFEHSSAALWEEDFSGVKKEINRLRKQGITDFRAYFQNNSEEVSRIASKITVVNVNPGTVTLMHASSKDVLLGKLDSVINSKTIPFITEELIAVAEEAHHIEGETVNTALDGEEVHVLTSMSIPQEGKDVHHVLLNMMDISERTSREKEREHLLARLQEEKLYSETMREITISLNSITDQEKLFDILFEQAERIVPYATANIRTIEGNKLRIHRRRGYENYGADEFMKQFVENVHDFEIIDESLESGRPVIIHDTNEDPRWIHFPETAYIRCAIILPIRSSRKTYGILTIEHGEPNYYGSEDAEKLVPFASTAALAFEKAEFYGKLKEKLKHAVEDHARISDSLTRKETMLKEIHHRLKNNLTLITSLINLKSSEIEDSQSLEVLEELKGKIYSISLLHEKLYRSGDLEHIVFRDYAEDLLRSLSESITDARAVEVDNRIDSSIQLSSEQAIPIGLILNELFTNSVKYGSPAEGLCRITMESFKRDSRVLFSFRDNGSGFDEDFSLESGESLGTQLIRTLSEQLGGSATLGNRSDAEVIITF